MEQRLDLVHVLHGLHEGDGHGVHAEFHAESQLFAVLIGDGGKGQRLSGQSQPLAGGNGAAFLGGHDEALILHLFLDAEAQAAVGEHEGVAGHKSGKNAGMVEGNEGELFLFTAFAAESELVAAAQLDAAFGQDAYADLGSGQILHDGQRTAAFLFDFTDVPDHFAEEVGIAVGKIETKDGNARFGELGELFPVAAGGAYGGNNLGTHEMISFP